MLTSTKQITYTTTTNSGVFCIRTNILTIMPAAVALGVRAWDNFYGTATSALIKIHHCSRNNQNKSQIV
jgi:hypothetical protein